MEIPAEGVPVDAFWSLSLYEPDSTNRLYFYENEIDRYAMNSASEDLIVQDDGTIVLAIQPERPDDPKLLWMPTPNGPFQAVFRAYLPREEIRSGKWKVPPIELVS